MIPYIFIILFLVVKKPLFKLARRYFERRTTKRTLSRIICSDDLLHLQEAELIHLIEWIFIKSGHKVEYADRCGCSRHMIVGGTLLVEAWLQPLDTPMDTETAMKLEKCMRAVCLHRGMLITLGDFKTCTRLFCHKNVIECVGGDRLLAMCRQAQTR